MKGSILLVVTSTELKIFARLGHLVYYVKKSWILRIVMDISNFSVAALLTLLSGTWRYVGLVRVTGVVEVRVNDWWYSYSGCDGIVSDIRAREVPRCNSSLKDEVASRHFDLVMVSFLVEK